MEFIYVITATLEDTFVVSPLLMFPVLKVIGMIGFRILAILDIFLMILVGALCGRGAGSGFLSILDIWEPRA